MINIILKISLHIEEFHIRYGEKSNLLKTLYFVKYINILIFYNYIKSVQYFKISDRYKLSETLYLLF